MNPASERRRAPRARADFPIRLSPVDGATPARLKDLSTNGLCCTTGVRLKEMALVGVELQLPGQAQRHTLQGAVVRCAPVPGQQGKFEIAIFFTNVGDATRTALGAYVDTGSPSV